MTKFVQMATEEILGHNVTLDDHGEYFFLHVEDDEGYGVLGVKLSNDGKVIADLWRQPQTKNDFTWVLWAQTLIEQKG